MTIKAIIYPSKTEPILPEGEREGTPQPFQWFMPIVQPYRAWTPAYTWVRSAELGIVGRPLVSMWFQQAGEPVRQVPRSLAALLANGAFVDEPAALADPAELQWVQPLQEPTPPSPPVNVAESTVDPTTLLPRITVDRWFKQTEEPVRQVPRSLAALLSDGVFCGEPSDFFAYEPAGLEWFRPVIQPHGKWTPSYTWVYSAGVATIDRPLVSQWFKQPEEPVRQPLRSLVALLSNGDFVGEPGDLDEEPAFDPAGLQWFRQTEEPVRQPLRLLTAILLHDSFVGDPSALSDPAELDWFHPAGEPLRLVQPINVGTSFEVAPLTYNPQGLQWFRATGEPVRVTARSLAALLSDGVFCGDPGDFFAYDPSGLEWFHPLGEPVLTTPINPSAIMGGTDGNVDILPAPPVVDASIKHRGFTQNVGKMVG